MPKQPKLTVEEKIERLSVLADLILSNPTRLKMIAAITDFEKSVGDLAAIGGVSLSAASQHLSKLKAYGVVSFYREAQTMHYRANSDVLAELGDLQREVLA